MREWLCDLGGLDILVSNAAFQMTHDSLDEISDEEWDRTIHTNISAMFHLCKAAIPRNWRRSMSCWLPMTAAISRERGSHSRAVGLCSDLSAKVVGDGRS